MDEQVVTLRDPDSLLLGHSAPGRVPVLLDGDAATSEVPLILAHLGWPPVEAFALARFGRTLALLDGIAVWNRDLQRPDHERSPAMQELERTRAARILDGLNIAAHEPLSVEGVCPGLLRAPTPGVQVAPWTSNAGGLVRRRSSPSELHRDGTADIGDLT